MVSARLRVPLPLYGGVDYDDNKDHAYGCLEGISRRRDSANAETMVAVWVGGDQFWVPQAHLITEG
jgi:hypothetical protein